MKYSREEHFKFKDVVVSESGRQTREGDFFCVLDGKTYHRLKAFTMAIRHQGHSSIKNYYDEFYKTDLEGICRNDRISKTKFENILDGYREYCGICEECKRMKKRNQSEAAKNPETIAKKREGQRIAAINRTPEKWNEMWEQRKDTTLRNNGSDYFSRKTRLQWERRTEEEIQRIVDKANATKDTNDSHFGGSHFGLSGRKVMIGQNEYFLQGYEDAVARALYDLGIEFTTSRNVPKIRCPSNKSGFAHPDLFIPKMNLIIEVKSDWTFSVDFERLIEIEQNAVREGYQYVVFAIKSLTKERSLIFEDRDALETFLGMTISSQASKDSTKVQRLSGDTEYRPNAIGSGSARVPHKRDRSLEECDIVYSA